MTESRGKRTLRQEPAQTVRRCYVRRVDPLAGRLMRYSSFQVVPPVGVSDNARVRFPTSETFQSFLNRQSGISRREHQKRMRAISAGGA